MRIARAAIEGVDTRGQIAGGYRAGGPITSGPITGAQEPGSREPGGQLEVGPLPTGIGVVVGESAALRAELATLVGETLFGVRLGRPLRQATNGRPPGEAAMPADALAGEVDVAGGVGRFRLRRTAGGGEARYSIAGLDGSNATPDTLQSMLGGVSADTAARVCFSGPTTHDDLAGLLDDRVARDFRMLSQGVEGRMLSQGVEGRPGNAYRSFAETPGASGGDALFARRDQVAHEIERRLAGRRRVGAEHEARLKRLEAEHAELTTRRSTLARQLSSVEAELAEVASRLRYRAIAEQADRDAAKRESADWRPKVDQLEDQIAQWRETLAELEQREAEVRSELSIIHPDDAEPSLPLADQRAGIAVARRLVEDLESEVARLARSAASDLCVCRDAHPRLNPLVDTLGKQLARLEELSDQQDRALHVQALQAEAAHLARSQDDLRKQIDHLLGRRQALWRTTRARPEGHAQPDDAADSGGEAAVGVTAERRVELDARQAQIEGEIAALDGRLGEMEAERKAIAYKRSTLLTDASLEALQAELTDLEARLHAGVAAVAERSTEPAPGHGRASEWLAKLADGRFSGLRLVDGGRRAVVLGARGEEFSAESLTQADRQLVVMSLRLALLGGMTRRGAPLPLVLDEPFAGLDARRAAILANVLDDFSRLGVQVVVFTGCQPAIDRFKALGAPLLKPAAPVRRPAEPRPAVAWRVEEPSVAPAPTAEPVQEQPAGPLTTVRSVSRHSEYLLAPGDPIDRFPVPMRDRAGVFARSRIRTVEDLMTADPSAVAEELDRDDVSAELVALWQTHLALVCFVPEMTLGDAALLTAAGVLSVDDLAGVDADALATRIAELLATERGDRYRQRGYAASRQQASDWVRRASRGAKHWRTTDAWSAWQRHRGERRSRVEANGKRAAGDSRRGGTLRVRSAEGDGGTPARRRNGSRTSNRANGVASQRSGAAGAARAKWRFYLETSSPVVDAPSIGPKTAQRIAKAGVRTVADLLAADADAVAAAMDHSRITAETVVAWQHQAGLVCRIPQLRGHDAQVLVACGFTAPEEIASMKPAELLEFVEPFCTSAEGEKVLRGNKTPDLAEVSDWITWARHCRLLSAA